jgi:hypothetical protein
MRSFQAMVKEFAKTTGDRRDWNESIASRKSMGTPRRCRRTLDSRTSCTRGVPARRGSSWASRRRSPGAVPRVLATAATRALWSIPGPSCPPNAFPLWQLGFEDLNENDATLRDSLSAMAAGKSDPLGSQRGKADRGKALASPSTLNRLELGNNKTTRAFKIRHNPEAIEMALPVRSLLVDFDGALYATASAATAPRGFPKAGSCSVTRQPFSSENFLMSIVPLMMRVR